MKGKQLAILLGVGVVLGGAGLLLQKGNQSSWTSSGTGGAGAKVTDFPINEVATVRIKSADAELNLVRKDDAWTVQERANYPASYEQVSSLLRKLWELKTVQPVEVGASQMPRLELVEPGKGEKSGTLVEFKDKDGKNFAALLLGKKHLKKSEMGGLDGEGFPAGRYVMPVGGAKVSLVSESLEEADPKPERWLKKDFFKIENPKAITLAGQTEAMRWTLTRENATAEWKLADAKPEEALDTSKVSSFATLFAHPSFKDVLAADAKPEETGLDKPTAATFETFDGFTYTLIIGKLTNDAYPVKVAVSANFAAERTPGKDEKPEDKTKLDEEFKAKRKQLEEKLAAEKKFEGHAFLLEKFTLDPLLKDRAALLAEKKPEPATTSTPAAPAPAVPPVSVTTPPLSAPVVATPPVATPPSPAPTAAPAPTPAATPTVPPLAPPTESAPAPAPPPPATPPAPTPSPEALPPATAAPPAPPAPPSPSAGQDGSTAQPSSPPPAQPLAEPEAGAAAKP